jgi:hypothetical protein
MSEPETRKTLEDADLERLKLLSLRAGVVKSNKKWDNPEEQVHQLDNKISKGSEKIKRDMAELQSTMGKVLTMIEKVQPVKLSRLSQGFGFFDPLHSSSPYKNRTNAEGQSMISAAGLNTQHGHLIARPVRKL